MAEARMTLFARASLAALLTTSSAWVSCGPKANEPSQNKSEAQSKVATPIELKPETQVALPADVPSEMVLIPEAEIRFARPDGADAKAAEAVKLGSFLIDRLEATVAEYLACRSSGACTSPIVRLPHCNASEKEPRPAHPINCISWHEAQRYCAFKSKRLPTAAEWELAARSTDQRHYPWGNDLPTDQLCWQGKKKKRDGSTCAVGTHPAGASPYGVQDMAGNVAEWTATILEGVYPQPVYDTRGGGYAWEQLDKLSPDDTGVRADSEGGMNASSSDPLVGVRCARSLNDTRR